MREGPLQQLLEIIRANAGDWAAYVGGAALVLVALVILWKIVAGRRREALPPPPDLSLDVAALGTIGPPPGPPVLEHYHVPVRLAAVVLAPTGRVQSLPPPREIPALVDHLLPGLAQIMVVHGPLIRRWPAQLSAQGFAHNFFAHVRLPGDRGKGTPWCSVAGRFKVRGRSYMAGLVMRAESPNNFGQSIAEEEHQWLGILRVKGPA